MEVWEKEFCPELADDDEIDNMAIPLSSPLDKFNLSNSLTVQGHHNVGNLVLSYGNLTTDPTSSNSAVQPNFSTLSYTPQGNYLPILSYSLKLLLRTILECKMK